MYIYFYKGSSVWIWLYMGTIEEAAVCFNNYSCNPEYTKKTGCYHRTSCLSYCFYSFSGSVRIFLISICKMLDLWGFMKKLTQKFWHSRFSKITILITFFGYTICNCSFCSSSTVSIEIPEPAAISSTESFPIFRNLLAVSLATSYFSLST